MATLARLQKRLAQAEDRKNRRVFLSTMPVEVQKVCMWGGGSGAEAAPGMHAYMHLMQHRYAALSHAYALHTPPPPNPRSPQVVDDRQERLEKAEYLQIFVDPSPYAPMAEVTAGSHSWMLTGINHTLKSWSRRGEPTYVFSEVDDLHPDAFYAVIFPRGGWSGGGQTGGVCKPGGGGEGGEDGGTRDA